MLDLLNKKVMDTNLAKYRTILLFITRVIIIYLSFLLLKFVHRSLIDPENNFAVASALRDFDIYSIIADTIIYPSKWLLTIFGFDVQISERTVNISGIRGVIIHAPCMGFNVISLFITLIVAYPGKVKAFTKIIFILTGILLIHMLNILRVTALLLKNRFSDDLIINHHDLYNYIIYTFVFIAFYVWMKYYSKPLVI